MKKVSFFEVITPPDECVCTLSELKSWLRIDGTDEDTELTLMLEASEDKVACYINQVLVSQTVRGSFDDLELSQLEQFHFISYKKFPLQSVSSVKYYDGSAYVTLDTDEYILKQRDSGFPRILLKNNTDILCGNGDIAYPIQIEAIVGYADAASVPKTIKTAILMYAALLYSSRGDCSECVCDSDGVPALPKVVRMALSKYKLQEVFG